MDTITNINLSSDGTAVIILDQSLLPSETKYITLREPRELCDAIETLKIRGAPAIGIFAAFALYVLALQANTEDYAQFHRYITHHSVQLNATRPTAVNLATQLRRMEQIVERNAALSVRQITDLMREEAQEIQREDIAMCKAISEHGLTLISGGYSILTHCNAGPLATSHYGTGLGTILLAHERQVPIRAFCCETRPLLQGARLTTYELTRAGVDTTLICDNMASAVMQSGKINAVFVGCDRVARNGDVANKIGTSGLAILAKHYGIPFYVFCPSSTIDLGCASGAEIEIEQRHAEEITHLYFEKPIAPDGVRCYNPSFDVTDSSLITAIITESGIYRPPFKEGLGK